MGAACIGAGTVFKNYRMHELGYPIEIIRYVFSIFFQKVCKYEICTLAADYKSKKGGIDSFIFSLPNSTLKDIVDRIGMLRSNFTEARQFAEAIVQWVEINCYCLDIDSI